MAEKKFFVDINLQGSALTNAKIGTNSGIGSTEGAFGYDSSAHRLQYFDGTATKEVANLSDIAAVTGGLIFQGGYDPTTNTPDITDGTAYKGFFWVATAAGTFLGESVQVGDSIVAKVDNASTNAADWLILQGNVVIATDSVDGISRLATQTEANDGTEGGAVVITPATLQGKIDAQITPEINSKLPLSGGTMSGSIDMNGSDITNVSVIRGDQGNYLNIQTGAILGSNIDMNGNSLEGASSVSADSVTVNNAPIFGTNATNKTYVDDQDALKVSKSGDTMSGNLDMGGNGLYNANEVITNTLEVNYLYSISGDPINIGNSLDAQNYASIKNLPAPTNGGDAANKTYVDDNTSNKLPLAGGTMSGDINMGTHNINNGGNANFQGVYVENAGINLLDSKTGDYINVVTPELRMGGNGKLSGLTSPTNGGDAANKDYVDNAASTAQSNAQAYADSLAPNYDPAGSAATAESNANAYTDARANTHQIFVGDWTLDNGVYSATFNSGLPVGNLLVNTYLLDGAYLRSVEFDYKYDSVGNQNPTGPQVTIYSNILPTDYVYVTMNKA